MVSMAERLPYYLRIDLREEPVLAIELKDDSGHAGHPVIDGITLGDIADAQRADSTRFLVTDGTRWLIALRLG